MKVVILTTDAPLYIARFLDDLLAGLRGRHEVVGVYAFGPYQRLGRWTQLRKRLQLYGFVTLLRMIGLIARNKLSAMLGRPTSVFNVLAKYGLSCERPAEVNSSDFIARLRRDESAVLLSIACPQILKGTILSALPYGCINYHTGALPRYRGAMPMYWALFYGERHVGITVHEMDEKIDNGPIIVQQLLPIDESDTLHSLYLKTTAVGPRLIVQALDKLEAQDKSRLVNDPNLATVFRFPTPQQAREFRHRGGRFL